MQHTWCFFNVQSPSAERSIHADSTSFYKRAHSLPSDNSTALSRKSMGDAARSSFESKERSSVTKRRLSLQSKGRRFRRAGTLEAGGTTQSKDSELFQPGEYIYTFELAIGNDMPESINVQYGSVKWQLEALVGRTGWFSPNIAGTKEVTLVRVPGENSIERTEPIVHRKCWDDSLRYDIVISGKCFALGSRIPIAFTFTPLATVRCLRVEMALTEEVERFAKDSNSLPSRLRRSIRLLERDEDGTISSAFPGSSIEPFLTRKPDDDRHVKAAPRVTIAQQNNTINSPLAQTEIVTSTWDFLVQLPKCDTTKEHERIHVDAISKHIQVRHWIKVCPSSYYNPATLASDLWRIGHHDHESS